VAGVLIGHRGTPETLDNEGARAQSHACWCLF
jgi:hypothetical protein